MNRIRHIRFGLIVAALLAAGAVQHPVLAQDIRSRLSADRLGDVEPGQYQAGDRLDFVLAPDGNRYLLKFATRNEVFVLSADRASMGGRMLKYDSGAMAAQVAGWGGLTLYPDDAPNGLPAVRTGDALPMVPQEVTLDQLQNAADEAGRALNIAVTADWTDFASDAQARAIGMEALDNAIRGVELFVAGRGRPGIAGYVDTVKLVPDTRPALVLADKTLTVGFDPKNGYAGRLSSRAVAQTLNGLIPK